MILKYGHFLNIYFFRLMIKIHISTLPEKNTQMPECLRFCRVPDHEHSTKIHFAECQMWHTACQNVTECRLLAKKATRHVFAECQRASTRQRRLTCPARASAVRQPSGWLTAVSFCRVLQGRHSAKMKLRRVPVGGTRPSPFRWVPATWHSAKNFYFFFIQTFLLSTQIWKVNP